MNSEVAGALSEARRALGEIDERANLGAWMEIAALNFNGSRHHASPWGTYFGPMGSREVAGKTIYFPDIEEVSASCLNHWATRANTVKHPILKARYSDLFWDFGNKIKNQRRNPEMARIAIDAYLASVSITVRKEIDDRFLATIRAIDLAVTISDENRKRSACKALLELHREAINSDQGRWWYAADRLIDDKNAVAN